MKNLIAYVNRRRFTGNYRFARRVHDEERNVVLSSLRVRNTPYNARVRSFSIIIPFRVRMAEMMKGGKRAT